MKKIKYLFILIIVFGFTQSYAQTALPKGGKQLNAGFGFSNVGTPIYVGVDFAVHDDVTIGPQVSYRNHRNFGYDFNIIGIAFTANYHFNTILEIPSNFDFYAGITLGYYIYSEPTGFLGTSSSGTGVEGQIGGRYYFDSKWGINLEFGGGNITGGKIGISYKF